MWLAEDYAADLCGAIAEHLRDREPDEAGRWVDEVMYLIASRPALLLDMLRELRARYWAEAGLCPRCGSHLEEWWREGHPAAACPNHGPVTGHAPGN